MKIFFMNNHLLLFSMSDQLHHWKGLLVIVFVGAVAGLLAGLILRSSRSLGPIVSTLLGIAGGWVCHTFFGNYFNFAKSHLLNEIISATAGALILTLIINLVFGSNKGKDRTYWRA